ncbi:mandelate racemase/muconate lactonizing enzyme family protein [Amnibacterium sp. CER49]|uniref:mandelate racemase/muconate lactonizing enzyme family protein n=1 Tax=Amnibacterium sp. CER49 TaxID=3039161 RepID=UPI00244B17E2|nr:mandelate racemase/muconate lactonizing enzyme family protein [Amnibacterium sp. CER49]MDH2444105.1 mandelate racemase/muconate lactonizing enzyme family protein [Amnibacterium sp. CER49]
MRIDAVDFFYLSMPEVTLEADGSQDALLVRVAGDNGVVGWGECEASPLTSIAAFVTPRSHGVCRPVADSVLGETIDGPEDITRITAQVQRNSMDLLQAAHTFSGVEMALWDLLGRTREQPAWSLLGYASSHGKQPYASMLFGETPEETRVNVLSAVERGFRAVKVGWEGFGAGHAASDADHLAAAREGLGDDGVLLVDAGQIWIEDVAAASERIESLEQNHVTWLEEPFLADSYKAYAQLAARGRTLRLAGGEGAHNARMALNLIDYGRIGYVQIDCGRIGGLGPAKQVADYAVGAGVVYVNHTFTSHLALSASLQPFAGLENHRICEYPAEPKQLAIDMTVNALRPDQNGLVFAPDAPGLGIEVSTAAIATYGVPVRIEVGGAEVFSSGPSVFA